MIERLSAPIHRISQKNQASGHIRQSELAGPNLSDSKPSFGMGKDRKANRRYAGPKKIAPVSTVSKMGQYGNFPSPPVRATETNIPDNRLRHSYFAISFARNLCRRRMTILVVDLLEMVRCRKGNDGS